MTEIDNDTLPPLTLGRSMWAIRGDALPRIVEAHRAGRGALDRFAGRFTAATPKAARRTSSSRAGGAVAVIPLTGVITPRGSFLSMLFGGGGGLIDFRDAFREAIASPDVGAIVLDVDSPGGLIDLVPETADEVRAAAGGDKPIIAVANTMAASAAYWIAAQADELIVTPSGDVGSIGVYMVHEDWSGFNEKQGINPTYISQGRYKTEGNPDEPLSDEAHAAWQGEVDELYGMFVDAVAAGRGITAQAVRDGYGEGRTLLASRALEAGMVDRVDTFENVVRGLLNGGGSSSARAAAVTIGTMTIAQARDALGLPAVGKDGLQIPRAEVTPPPAGAETNPPDPAQPVDPAQHPSIPDPDGTPAPDPTHVPADTPPVTPPADPAAPDTGPDAASDAAAARAAMAAVLVG